MQLMASEGRTWEASSKMTTSNRRSGERYIDTVSGLIMKHGFSSVASGPTSARSCRIGLCRLFLFASRTITCAWRPVSDFGRRAPHFSACLLYTSDAADEEDSVDLG